MAVCSGITYNSTDNIITVDYINGDTHGDSFNNPYTFQDIYDTDVANDWGIIQKLDEFYFSDTSIYIQGIDTYFKPGGFVLKFSDNVAGYVFKIINNANFESIYFSKIFYTGVYILYSFDSPNITFENATISARNLRLIGGSYNNLNITARVNLYSIKRFTNIKFINKYSPIITLGSPEEMYNIVLDNCKRAINVYSGGTIRNLTIYNSVLDFHFSQYRNGEIITLIDSKANIDSYDINLKKAVPGNFLKFKSTFKINISNGDTGTAVLYDQFGSQVAQQTLSGEWALTNPVTYVQRFVETDGTQIVENTKTIYEPFKLVVTKDSYDTLTIPNIFVTAGEETNIYGEMVKSRPVDENAVTYTSPEIIETINTSADLTDTIETEVVLCQPT